MYKFVILEDEEPQLERLESLFARFGSENPEFSYSLEVYDRGIKLLNDYQRDADIMFLDIRVPDMLGIDVARKVREVDSGVMIIFITGLSQYAIEGYSVDAFEYVLKPVNFSSFSAKLKRALRVLNRRSSELTLDLRNREGQRRISASEIIYIESSDHDIFFHTDNEQFRQWGTLSSYEEHLSPAGFARISGSYLVNLKYVENVRKDAVIVNGTSLPLSRSKRPSFLAALAKYKGGTR